MITISSPISVIIPTFNEHGFIVDCLKSVVANSYPPQDMEIIVVDGGSTDGSVDQINEFISTHPTVKLLHNPKKIVPCAMNIGIAEAHSDTLLWLGAHAIYDVDYLANSVRVLHEENCASAGGVIRPIGKAYVGKAIAVATTSKFGIGNAKYRHAKQRQSVDTVFGGCWKKQNILKIGGFNENWVRNQDYELNCRLREEIGEIILDPSIHCEYFCRESISALARQYFNYGFWRFKTFLEHPSSFTSRQAAPLLLLFGLLFSALIAPSNPGLAILPPLMYGGSALMISVVLGFQNRKPGYLLLLPIIFATLHLCWALGFSKSALQTLARKILPR